MALLMHRCREAVRVRDDERVAAGAKAEILRSGVEQDPVTRFGCPDEIGVGKGGAWLTVDRHVQLDDPGAASGDVDDITPAPVDHPATIPTGLLASGRGAAQG